ncbi:MAG: hypothetical protein GTO41_12655, partial [Burkholderiales bacterium]|nr:hypothetical protein [Burkholderiales bacterium]
GTLAAALGGTIAGWACTSFGVKRQRDWPIGPILAQAHGVLRNSTFWICAQPVHLAIDGNGLFLRPYSELHLSSDESQMLFSFLQSRLAEHDLEMAHIDTGLWCIGTRGRHKLSTVDIDWAVHRRVDSLLPSGEDAAWWQRLLVEVQMSLHEHPLNLAREERGQVSVNSIWLWGGGTVPVVRRHFDKICVFDPVLRAIALMSQAQQIDLPANVE